MSLGTPYEMEHDMTPQVVTPNRATLTAQLERLNRICTSAPRPLSTVLTVLNSVLHLAGDEDFPQERARLRTVNGPGGTWKVARFAAHGQPWVGIEWPAETDRMLTNWLEMVAHDSGLDSGRPGVPPRQLWIHLGAS